jgi:hypothetical protein
MKKIIPIIKPTGLKGSEILNRTKELMGIKPINESVNDRYDIELTKIGPDNKAYAIVRENHEYFIKVSDRTENLIAEDFKYIGGLKNKKSEAYPTYAKAIKQLNLKFISLNEAHGLSGTQNVFLNDNLITEHHPYKADQKLSSTKAIGDGAEYIIDKDGVELSTKTKEGKESSEFGDNVAKKDFMDEFEEVKLTENEMAIDKMLGNEDEEEFIPHGTYTVSNSGGFEIMISNDGSSAKVRDAFGSDNPEISDWLEIEFVDDEDNDGGDLIPVIDPNGYNIPLNMVMRINEVKNGRFSISKTIAEMDNVIDDVFNKTDKINEILTTLTESEKSILFNSLKKKI